MEYINSYIFLNREKNNKSNKKNQKDDTIVIQTSPSFKQLLNNTFKNINFDNNDNNFEVVSGVFQIENEGIKSNVFFKYHNVWNNYYLDVIVKLKKNKEAADILAIVNKRLIDKHNFFDKYFISIVSYDYTSEYYCNKLFPYLNKFERKLRKILFSIYTLNFNLEYYSATTSEEFQGKLKQKSNISRDKNIDKKDIYIKQGFYSLDYNDVETLLFTKSVTKKEREKLQNFLSKNSDLTKLTDGEIRKAFELCSSKTDWERFFYDKNINSDFQHILNDIRVFRNDVDHCRFISKEQYKKYLAILKEIIKSLDNAIKIIEMKDFFLKNIELKNESFDRLISIMRESLDKIYNPFSEYISNLSQSMSSLTEEIVKKAKPLSFTIPSVPNIVLPEIELSKYNIPNYFELFSGNRDEK